MYYINPIWFYLMSICENLQDILMTISVVLGSLIFGISLYYFIDGEFEEMKQNELIKKCITPFIICVILACFIPSKETCKEMLIASCITHENVEYAKDTTKELVDYIFEKIENESKNE